MDINININDLIGKANSSALQSQIQQIFSGYFRGKKDGDDEDPDIIVTDYKNEQYDCKPLSKIASHYMFQATPALGPLTVLFKELPCSCDDCIFHTGKCNFTNVSGRWKKRTITPKVTSLLDSIKCPDDESDVEYEYNLSDNEENVEKNVNIERDEIEDEEEDEDEENDYEGDEDVDMECDN